MTRPLDTRGTREALSVFTLVCDLDPTARDEKLAALELDPDVLDGVKALLVEDHEDEGPLAEQNLLLRRAALERLLLPSGGAIPDTGSA